MINTDMRLYNYYSFGEKNSYGQPQLIKDENGKPVIQGSVKMSINTTSTSIQDNIHYKKATYIGLTQSALLDDKKVIQYGDELLKVLYINQKGRYKQVFMGNM
jgi:hypothetical protein